MKALSLFQPWATLVALGAKRIETRTWPTHYRGPLAIHSSKGWGAGGLRGIEWSVMDSYPAFARRIGQPLTSLPRGFVVATCTLADCVCISDETIPMQLEDVLSEVPGWNAADEHDFGGYALGRFAWFLTDIQALPTPIPARGALGLWNWEPECPTSMAT